MTPEKRSPGRPRLYESSSEKVEAFRKRQESAGYSRKEVLVTQETVDQLGALAKTHGVSVTDVASALLEHGLIQYQATSTPPFAGLDFSGKHLFAGASGSTAGSLAHAESPVLASPQTTRSLRSGSVSAFALNAIGSSGATASSSPLLTSDTPARDPITSFFERRKAPK